MRPASVAVLLRNQCFLRKVACALNRTSTFVAIRCSFCLKFQVDDLQKGLGVSF